MENNFKKWKNRDVLNARDYVHERDEVIKEINSIEDGTTDIAYDNTETNIDATTVAGAITELDSDLSTHIGADNPHQLSLDDLTDVEVTGAPTGHVLRKASNGTWVPSNLEDFSTTFATDAELTAGLATKADEEHTHDIEDVTGLQDALDGKSDDGHTHTKSEITDFAHTHPISEITNLQTTLESKADTITVNGQLANKVDKDISTYPSVENITDNDTYYLYQNGAKKVTVGNLKTYLTSELTGIQIQVVASLESVENPQPNFIYLVQDDDPVAPDIYDEYVWVNDAWEYLGVRDIDLANYYDKDEADALLANKADVSLLSSNIVLYPTNVASDISGYFKMVTSPDDTDYNDTAVNVPTGTITSNNQLIASLSAPAGLFTGNPGIINVPTIGNIRKVGGNSNAFAEFYFEIYKRSSGGTETLIATSDTTGAINPTTNEYNEFSTYALLNNGNFLETDRLVIKYYANLVGNSGASYEFQFGGDAPVRTLLPVPVSVLISYVAENTTYDNTDSGLTATNVQDAIDELEDGKVDLVGDSNITGNVNISGNVGIGTTSPTYKLHIHEQSIQPSILKLSNDNSGTTATDGLDLGYFHPDAYLINREVGRMFFRTSNQDRMAITADGNVGVGTTDPKRLLNLVTSTNQDGLQVRRNSSTANDYATIGLTMSTVDTPTNLAELRGVRTNRVVSGDTDLRIATQSNGTLAERMTIRDDGNVGIGTTSPGSPLEIKQSANTISGGLILRDTTGGFTGRAYVTTGNFILGQGGNDNLALSSTGKVGIGTTDPQEKLDVNGNIKASGTVTTPNVVATSTVKVGNWILSEGATGSLDFTL